MRHVLRHGRLLFPQASGDLGSDPAAEAANIKETGASVVAMDCPGCVMQIRGGFDQDAADVKVKHTVELLAEQVEG